MNHATALLLIVAAVCAVGNWISRLIESRVLEYLTKPVVTALLMWAAITIDPRSSSARPWFVAGLALSLAGDVLLMLPKEQFVGGLGSFLLAHVAYIAGFIVGDVHVGSMIVTLIVVALVMVPVAATVLTAVRQKAPELQLPVAVYMLVIGVMIVCAGGSQVVVAVVGAAVFAFSDSLIAWTKFVRPMEWAGVAIMVTYHLGQVGILFSLTK